MSVPVGASLQADVGQLLVDGDAVVVEAGGLEDDARRAHHHRHREDPQEQAVQHHRHVLPVLLSLGSAVASEYYIYLLYFWAFSQMKRTTKCFSFHND